MLVSGRWTQSRVVDNLSSFESESWKHPSKFEAGHDRRQEYLHTNKDVSDRVIVKRAFLMRTGLKVRETHYLS